MAESPSPKVFSSRGILCSWWPRRLQSPSCVSPWANGYIESFNGKLRDELLNGEIFDTLPEAKMLTERWQGHYEGGVQSTQRCFLVLHSTAVLTIMCDTVMVR